MNQNVLNSSTWLKKLSTDGIAVDRSGTKRAGMESAFGSLLNNQLSKASLKSNGNLPTEQSGYKSDAKSFLKKVEPTANRLAVKAPEQTNMSEAKPVESKQSDFNQSEKVSNESTVVGENNSTKDSNVSKLGNNEAVDQKNEALTDDENGVKVEAVMNMLQQVLSSLINQLTENPELGKKEQLQEQIQSLSNLLSEISGMKSFKVDLKTASQIKNALESMLTVTEKSTTLNAEAMNMLKAAVKDIKEKYSKIDSKTFNNVLEQKMDSSTNAKADTSVLSEAKATDSTMTSIKAEANNVSSKATAADDQSNNTQDKALTFGKEKVTVQSNANESKTLTVNNAAEFNAKLESASIAFGKAEIANQVTRTPIQQSIMDQLINSPRMQIKQTEQGTMMTMKLNPEVLGDVEIKMEIVKGVLQAEIKVENMIVKGAIEAGLSDLKNALSDKGYQVDSLNVFVGKDGQGNQGQQQQQQNERQTHMFMEELELEKGQYGFDAVINDNQIDYRG